LTLFCDTFVDLHALDWQSFAADPSLYQGQDMSTIVGHQLSEWQAYTHALENDALDPIFDWLSERLPGIRLGRPCLIHMDYHPYNILLRENGTAFVIDWTGARVSDFRLDLAWTLLLMSSYGDPGARGTVLGEYQRLAGRSIKGIEYFDVMACLRRLVSILISLSDGAGKLGMRPGAEAMMKNASHIEAVYTLLRERSGITIPAVERLLSVL
jgi:aminoglycoside phosphotransferase (APT) family kinase protein